MVAAGMDFWCSAHRPAFRDFASWIRRLGRKQGAIFFELVRDFCFKLKKRFGFLPTCYSISRRLSILDPYCCFERLWFHVPSYSTKCLSQDCWVIFGTPKAPMSRPIGVWLKNMMQGEPCSIHWSSWFLLIFPTPQFINRGPQQILIVYI